MQYFQPQKQITKTRANLGLPVSANNTLSCLQKAQNKSDNRANQSNFKTETHDSEKSLRKRLDLLETRLATQETEPGQSFKIIETEKIRYSYLDQLMVNEVRKNREVFRSEFLEIHQVSSEVRVRMVKTSILFLGIYGVGGAVLLSCKGRQLHI